MKNYLPVLSKASIFRGITEKELESIFKCLDAKVREYNKKEFILNVNDSTEEMGLVISGTVLILQEDFWGNRNIRDRVTTGQIFAESFSCVPGSRMNVSVMAEDNCKVMWLKVNQILDICPTACEHHNLLVRNLIANLAIKNIRQSEKLIHMSQRTSREKLLSYLSSEAQRRGSREFEIPFNRQQLADYLSIERSAMSAELSKMQREGLLTTKKNRFTLIAE